MREKTAGNSDQLKSNRLDINRIKTSIARLVRRKGMKNIVDKLALWGTVLLSKIRVNEECKGAEEA